MSGINKVILVGRLGADPETKVLQGGATVAKLSIATSETWIKDGQKMEKTEWHRVVVWNKLAENCGKYLNKGRQVYVEGKLQTRSWDDNGTKKYATEIVAQTVQFLGASDRHQGQGQQQDGGFGSEPVFDGADEIPF